MVCQNTAAGKLILLAYTECNELVLHGKRPCSKTLETLKPAERVSTAMVQKLTCKTNEV